MKAVTIIAKILTVLAAVAGAIYLLATYGEKIVAWAKKIMESLPEIKACTAEELAAEAEADEAAEEESVVEEVIENAEEAAAEAAVAVEEFVEDIADAVEEVVADEADFEG